MIDSRAMVRFVIILLACGCQATGKPQPPLAVPPTEATHEEPAAAASPSETVAVPQEEFEFFWDEIDLDAEQYLAGGSRDLGQGLVLVGDVHKGPLGLLHTDTMEIDEISRYVGKPKHRPTITSAIEHGAVVASFTDREQRQVYFQVLRLNTLRWEKAGRFDIPASRALGDSPRLSSSWVQMREGELRLELSDEVDKRKTYVLDFETLVWTEISPPKIDHGPCLMSSVNQDDDRVRWGISGSDASAEPCVAVRTSTDDSWRVLDAPEELMFMRSIRPIDERRFLVTGGFKFAMFPFVHRADVVDVVAGEIRSLGKQSTGTELNVPGERFVWVAKDAVVRFDPQTEQFKRSPGPRLDFNPKWWLKLDDRRVLFAGHDDEKVARYVVAGFRPVP